MISQTPETLNLKSAIEREQTKACFQFVEREQTRAKLKPGTLNLVLVRTRTIGEYTHGSLSIDGTRLCSTLENSNAQVPSGEYQLSLLKCKHHSRKMPCLANLEPGTLNLEPGSASCTKCKRSLNSQPSSLNLTLPCYCPMIKPGNGVHNRLDGSILVGKFNTWGAIIHPKDAFDPLYERIRKSLSRGNQVTLTVLDG